jgi:rapamycin-insensitive companion of mTOR
VLSTAIPISTTDFMPSSSQHNLLDNYTVIILLAMIHCGLLDALITLGTGSNRALAEPAIELLADILRVSSRLLPDQHCAALLALPRLVAATSLSSTTQALGGDRAKSIIEQAQREKSIRASEMLAELAYAVGASSGWGSPSINNPNAARGPSLVSYGSSGVNGVQLASELLRDTNRLSALPYSAAGTSSTNSSSVSSSLVKRLNHENTSSRELLMQELKLSMDAQIDDACFKDMLYNRCRVLTDKNWAKWNWDIISELLEGPLTNPHRLSEAMKTKFFKRLSGFFRCDPGNKGFFSQLAWVPDYVPFLRPACQMYTLLLNHPEGLMFLKTDRRGQLLTEISAALELEARPEAAIVESHIGALKARMFSPEYCSRRMLREYFTLLGLMSSSKEGLKMMEQSNLFQRLYVMGTTKGHDFLCRLILANLDYSVDGSSRKLLQSWMTEGSKPLRLYATCLLRALLRSEVSDFAKWGIDALVTQLTQEEEVAKAALSVLEEAAETKEYLLAMIAKRPIRLLHLRGKRPAETLLLKFLSVPEGLAFLKEAGNWIPSTLLSWKRHRHIKYVNQVENALFRGLNRDVCGRERTASSITSSGGGNGRPLPTPIPVMVPMKRGSTLKQSNQRSHWGLDWIYRMPWNMEVKIIGPPGSGPPSNLILETYVDGSVDDIEDLRLDEDDLRMNSIRVKGIVVDARNIPQPVIVNSQQTLQACLFLGTQPVDRRGFTKPPPQSNGGFILPNSGSASDQLRTRSMSTAGGAGSGGVGGALSIVDRSSDSHMTNPLDYQDPSVPLPESALEENKDWSSCQPEQRSQQYLSAPECSICAPGERAVWNFRVEMDPVSGSVKRLLLKSVEFTLQLIPLRPRTVPLPRHMYGELAKTSFGCQILQASGHLPEFIACLRDPATVPLEKRAALWAIGHVAGTSRGYYLLHDYANDFLEVIVRLATNSPIVTIRGTCFFILGLISRSKAGRHYLSKLGWNASRDSRASIAVPQDSNALFVWPGMKNPSNSISPLAIKSSNAQSVSDEIDPIETDTFSQDPSIGGNMILDAFQKPQDSSMQHQEIQKITCPVTKTPNSPLQILLSKVPDEWKDLLRYVADLSNHITQKEAHSSLSKMKASKPELFEDPMLLLYVHALLEKYQFRLALRQFILNAFDRAVLSDEVLDTISNNDYVAMTTTSITSETSNISTESDNSTTTATRVPHPKEVLRRKSSSAIPVFTTSIQSFSAAAMQASGRISSFAGAVPKISGERGGLNSHYKKDNLDRGVLPRNRKRTVYSEHTIFVGAPEATV